MLMKIYNNSNKKVKESSKEITCYFVYSNNDSIFIRDLTQKISNYNIKTIKSMSLYEWHERENSIKSSDFFCIVVNSLKFIQKECEEKQAQIYKDINLAFELYHASENSTRRKPEIIFLGDDNAENLLDTQICKPELNLNLPICRYQYIKVSQHLQESEINGLISKILPPVTFIQNLDEEEEYLWLQASKQPYEEVFFPIPSERLPFEEIEKRIIEYNMRNSQEWYELYAIWHKNVNNVKKAYQLKELSSNVIGMGYYSLHLLSGWIFANYLAIDYMYRSQTRFNFFYQTIEEKIGSKMEMNNLKGKIFEIETIDFDFLVKVTESEINIKNSEIEADFITQFRRLRRLNWFTHRPNIYIILDDEGNPFPYIQPGMDEPLNKNDTPLILMVELLNNDLKDGDNLLLVREILDFLYNYLFMSDSDDMPEGYQENIEQVKLSVNDKFQKFKRCILGKMEDININNTKYSCRQLFRKTHRKVIDEGMSNQVRLV